MLRRQTCQVRKQSRVGAGPPVPVGAWGRRQGDPTQSARSSDKFRL